MFKGVSDLKTRLDYSYHHARSREKIEFSCPFVQMTTAEKNQATSQKLFRMTRLNSQSRTVSMVARVALAPKLLRRKRYSTHNFEIWVIR